MDEAASRLRMEVDSKPEELDRIDRQILQNADRSRGVEERRPMRRPRTGWQA